MVIYEQYNLEYEVDDLRCLAEHKVRSWHFIRFRFDTPLLHTLQVENVHCHSDAWLLPCDEDPKGINQLTFHVSRPRTSAPYTRSSSSSLDL